MITATANADLSFATTSDQHVRENRWGLTCALGPNDSGHEGRRIA